MSVEMTNKSRELSTETGTLEFRVLFPDGSIEYVRAADVYSAGRIAREMHYGI